MKIKYSFIISILLYITISGCTNNPEIKEKYAYKNIDKHKIFLNIIVPNDTILYKKNEIGKEYKIFKFDTINSKNSIKTTEYKYTYIKDHFFKNSDSLIIMIGSINDSIKIILDNDTLLNGFVNYTEMHSYSFQTTIKKKKHMNFIQFDILGKSFSSKIYNDFDIILFDYNGENGFDIMFLNTGILD